jgi:hypothetical protein
MEPPTPEALRGSVQNVESICDLLQTSSIIDEPPDRCHAVFFCISFFSVGLAAFFVLIYFCNCSTQHHAFFNRLL